MGFGQYAIGTTLVGLATLESLGIKEPKGAANFRPCAARETVLNGHLREMGAPVTAWEWGTITAAAKEVLRTYCSGASAAVFIETMDDHDAWKQYSAIMYWPEENPYDATRRIGLRIEFKFLEEQ